MFSTFASVVASVVGSLMSSGMSGSNGSQTGYRALSALSKAVLSGLDFTSHDSNSTSVRGSEVIEPSYQWNQSRSRARGQYSLGIK